MTNLEIRSLTIDGVVIEPRSDDTILTAAQRSGIEIPTLCYLKGHTKLESCGVCMVEVEGSGALLPACASKALPGMTVHTDTPELRDMRKTALDLLFSDHVGDCVAPCERACPAHIDIPGFLRAIRDGRPDESLRIIQESVAFTGVLGRVCPKFCERLCRRGDLDEPISICSLKRYPADRDREADNIFLPEKKPESGKTVIIVGGGIVGLTAAYYLLLEGHRCVLYEERDRLGGALDQIIPEFRMPSAALEPEIDRVIRLGAEVRYGKRLGRDFSLDELRAKADAVLLAIGATTEVPPAIEGGDLAESALELLKAASGGNPPRVEGTAVVVGAGPSAMDAARTLLRLGAERVSLIIQPSVTASLFFKSWIEDGIAEGVVISDESSGVRIEELSRGHFRIAFERGGETVALEADRVYLAGHVAPDMALLKQLGLKTTRHGIHVHRRTLSTELDGVFAAGNLAQAGRYAVQGSAAGKQVAVSIHRYLTGEKEGPKQIDVRLPNLSESEQAILFRDFPTRGRLREERLDAAESIRSLAEVHPDIPNDTARREAERCLGCDCAAKNGCLFRNLGTRFGANTKAYAGGERPPFERDASHETVIYESGKCVKCGRCVSTAEARREDLGLTYIGRGFQVKMGVPFGEGIDKGLRKAAEECVEVCPTGALSLRK